MTGSPFPAGGNPLSLAFGGKFLYSANPDATNPSISGFSIDPNTGALSPLSGSPFPLPGSDVQLYQPTYAFSVLLDDHHTTSNAFVVQYQIGAQVTDVLGGVPYDGASLVRDSVRIFRDGDASLEQAFAWIDQADQQDKPVVTVEGNVVIINGVAFPISTSSTAPAVNLGGTH